MDEEESAARAQRHYRTRLLASVLGAWIRAHDQAAERDGEKAQLADDYSRFRSLLHGMQVLQRRRGREAYIRFCSCLAAVFRRMCATSRLLRRCREASYPRRLQESARHVALSHYRSAWRNRRLVSALNILRSRARRRKASLSLLLQDSTLRQLASQCLARWKERSHWERLSRGRQSESFELHKRVFLLRRYLRRFPRPKPERQASLVRQQFALRKFVTHLDRRRMARLDIGQGLHVRYAQRRVIDRLLDLVAMRCFQRQRFARLVQQRNRKLTILALLCWLRRLKQRAVMRSLNVRAKCFSCTVSRYLRLASSWKRMRHRLLQVRQERRQSLSLRRFYLTRALYSLRHTARRQLSNHQVRAVAHLAYRSMTCALRAFLHRRQQHDRSLRANLLALHYFKLFRLAKGWKSFVSYIVTRKERRRKGLAAQTMFHQHLQQATLRACTVWTLDGHYHIFREHYLARKVVRKWRERLPRREKQEVVVPVELSARLLDWVHVRRSLPAPRPLPGAPIADPQSISLDLARTPPRVASLEVDLSLVDGLVQAKAKEGKGGNGGEDAEVEAEEKAKRKQRVELALQMIAVAQHWQQMLDQGLVS